MISTTQLNSVLILSFDKVEEGTDDLTTVLAPTKTSSEQLATDKELNQKASNFDEFIYSDVANKKLRIPIVIDDRILPAQHIASGSSTNKRVDYDRDVPVVTSVSNQVNVRLHLKSSLTQVSTISDILYAISDTVFPRYTTSARASFFGGTMCIFNGYLTGINRSTVDGSDMEIVNLTFERAKNETKPDEEKGKGKVNATPEPELADTTTGNV